MLRAKGKEKQGKVWETIASRSRQKKIQRGWHLSYEECETLSQSKQTGSRSSQLVLSGLLCLPPPVRIPTHGIFLDNSPPRQALLFRHCLQVIFVGPFSCSIETIRKKNSTRRSKVSGKGKIKRLQRKIKLEYHRRINMFWIGREIQIFLQLFR